MPDEEIRGIWRPKGDKKAECPDHIKIAVHFGPKEEMIAMATIDMDDLDTLVSALMIQLYALYCNFFLTLL